MNDLPPPGPPPPAATASKQEWRRWARSVRPRFLPSSVSQAVVSQIASWLEQAPPGRVVLYAALPDEVDLAGLSGLSDRPLALTRTPATGPLTIHDAHGPLERHPYGFLQPPEGTPRLPASAVGVVLVPGLVFDRRGNRLGRGAGFYDQLLAGMGPSTARVGVAVSNLVVEALPVVAHDQVMTHLATEQGVAPITGY